MTWIGKIGGSILRSEADYARVARALLPRLDAQPTWVVVSAANGVTDQLQALAKAYDPQLVAQILEKQARLSGTPRFPTLEEELKRGIDEAKQGKPGRLLAWGEQASAAALRAHLQRLGYDVPVVELTARQKPPPHWAAIVPGFYLRDRHGRARPLPRGGTDISAVLLAIRLGAQRVHYWKDGGGIRTDSGTIVAEIDAETLRAKIGRSIRPLHPATLPIAIKHGIELVLEDPEGRAPSTRIVSGRRQVPVAA